MSRALTESLPECRDMAEARELADADFCPAQPRPAARQEFKAGLNIGLIACSMADRGKGYR